MLDKEKLKQIVVLCWNKTKYYACRIGTWCWAVCYVCWNLYKTYAAIIIKRIKIRREFQCFGKEAYRQWKDGQYFSLKDKLNSIKAIEEEIHESSLILHRASEKFLDLFCLKSLISKIRLNKLRRQTLEQPEQPSVANPIVSESQSTVNKEKVLPVEPMPDKKSGESQSTPSKSVAKPNKQSKEEKIQVQKPKSRPTAKSRKKIPTTEKKSKPDIPS